jgi:hypothetical protein
MKLTALILIIATLPSCQLIEGLRQTNPRYNGPIIPNLYK